MIIANNRGVFSILQKATGARVGSVFMECFPGRFSGSSVSERNENERKLTINRRLYNTSALVGKRRAKTIMGRKPKRLTPTLSQAGTMPLSEREMNNDQLITLGAMGNSDARKEILRRHIMVQDNCSYAEASAKFEQIAAKNREGMWLLTLPYKIGITVAVTAATCSFPMVFDLGTVEWFNEFYVTADVPEPKDLETPLEVGSWAWSWMEPPLGQISFVLLCMQYIR